MESVFFTVIKEDCHEVSLSQKENGLLEIVILKECDDKEAVKYLCSLDAEECKKIVDKQKKAKEVFRNKVKILIDKYAEEFTLPFSIKFRIQTISKKINDCNVELHGNIFEGNLSIYAVLQFFSDEIVEKIIRNTVYSMACKYEIKYSEIKYSITNVINLKDRTIESSSYAEIPEELKYRVSLEYSEIKKIEADYDSAVKIVIDVLKKQPILAVKTR